jgi:GTP-binding protein HflX
MTRESHYLTNYLPTVLLLGIDAPYNRIKDMESYFQEFRTLARTNGVIYNHELYIRLRAIDPTFFLTKGKLEEVKKVCEEHSIDHIIISEPLTAQQESSLSDFFGCKVYDRTRLILEIFEKHAHSAEGKVQVALAMLQHKKTRLAGKGIHLSQQAGRIGGRGPGETAKEKETQHIEQTRLRLQRELERIERARMTQRKQRLTNKIPTIALIGYTNAGKSSILNRLTKSSVLEENKPFSTLDTTTRELFLLGQKIGVISDTVGFIQQLPPQLINAFKSTLSELQYADLLLHVVDVSDSNWESHIHVVNTILYELGIDKPMLYVFNKTDLLSPDSDVYHLILRYTPHVITHTKNSEGLEQLRSYLASWSTRQQ